tara:strand:- start:358 stop:810 length:453 start_codon:yes stop_codon:yes gene_type:complete
MNKQEWVDKINEIFTHSEHFITSLPAVNSLALVFACDIFRRRKHTVHMDIEASETGTAILKISISKKSNAFEFTIRRNDKAVDYIEQIHPEIQTISIRGCGTVIHVVFQIIEWAIHNGWLIDKSFIGTLTQVHQKNTQRNTTFRAILHRG